MSGRFPTRLAIVLYCAVAVPNPFCQAENSFRATSILGGDTVPACAQDCLLSSIKSELPTTVCPNPRDLSCLCSRRSTTGFTLGEIALRCVYISCLDPGIRELHVYSICSGIRNALPNTHSAITITPTTMTSRKSDPTPSTAFSETTFLPTSTPSVIPSSILATPTSSNSIKTSLSATLLSSTSTSTQPTGQPSESPEPPAAKDAPPMTSAQVIGVSIGGAAAGALVLALIIILLLKRRRKKMMANHESEFEIGGQMSEPPPQDFMAGYRSGPALGSPIGIYNEPVVRRLTLPTNNTRQSAASAPSAGASAGNFTYPYPTYRHSDSDDASLSTPNAIKSNSPRRISQLLPEKPTYEVHSSQHPITKRLGRRPDSSTTVFEDEGEDDRRALIAANNYWAPTRPSGGYNSMSTSRNFSQQQQYGHQYPAGYQNNGRQPQQQQRRQRRQPPMLRLVTPASNNAYQPRTNMTTSPPKVTYQRTYFGTSIPPNGQTSGEHLNFYPTTGAGAGAGSVRYEGSVEAQSSQNRRRANDRTSTGSVTSFESVESNGGTRNGNIAAVPKRTTVRLSPVRERSISPDPNACPKPLPEPLLDPPMMGPSGAYYSDFQAQGQRQGRNEKIKGLNSNDSRSYPYQYPHPHPYPYPYPYSASAANKVPEFPKFHQPLRPPIPPPKQEPQPLNQRQQHQYSPHATGERRNSETSSSSNNNSNSSNSLLSKRRGEAVADKMENELNVNKASGRRPSPLNSGNKSDDTGARVRGGLRTPSPSLAFQTWQKRQAQQQQQERRQGRENTSDDSDDYVEQFDLSGAQGRKLTPTRRGPDLYLNVE
ncbi:hypothetical protein AJ78_02894 [Emergomyces pasteurianus Ep9510]|uniref:Extracellular membrane protein CFEM domain-containing protein n=1 Tax=Emergomyces pasteurianus Ep9510 TaxID=1447872 RepID=A0A1J9PKD4_9EURO|nr:hypothetical protein AJ78_02894 [Emergomyces pasteurianus Ep9510]